MTASSSRTALEPLERLTAAPNVYLKTIDDAGHAIDAVTLNATAQAIRDVATTWGGGQFGVASVTQGTDTKVGVHGWFTVTWNALATSPYCGLSDVGRDGGDPAGAPYARLRLPAERLERWRSARAP
jgi:hypothetical protein